ncbi:MAG: alpha/beta hydrolase [Saprospiraceae bacterium]|nr:alpha/beta hydrolase [Saprospiraceae bacterium]
MPFKDKFIVLGNEEGKATLLYHANAYNPEMYGPFVRNFPDRKFIALKQRPLWDSNVKTIRDWSIFTEDLISFCDEMGINAIDAIGHSLGAVAIWKASVKRPDLFKNIVLIDPVVLPQETVRWVNFLPFKLKARIRPIIKIASLRKNWWASKEEAASHLGSKSVFKRFTPEVFDLFIQYGIHKNDDGSASLAYPREWEAMIYASPENIWKFLSKTEKEIFLIRAEHSNVLSGESWLKLQKHNNQNEYFEMKGVGHLIPFEKPVELARIIADYLAEKTY